MIVTYSKMSMRSKAVRDVGPILATVNLNIVSALNDEGNGTMSNKTAIRPAERADWFNGRIPKRFASGVTVDYVGLSEAYEALVDDLTASLSELLVRERAARHGSPHDDRDTVAAEACAALQRATGQTPDRITGELNS